MQLSFYNQQHKATRIKVLSFGVPLKNLKSCYHFSYSTDDISILTASVFSRINTQQCLCNSAAIFFFKHFKVRSMRLSALVRMALERGCIRRNWMGQSCFALLPNEHNGPSWYCSTKIPPWPKKLFSPWAATAKETSVKLLILVPWTQTSSVMTPSFPKF